MRKYIKLITGFSTSADYPEGWDTSWLAPPTITDTTVNGKTDACGLVCNVLDIGDRNYFSCIATGDYTVNVYTKVNGSLISTQDVASGVQADWQIDYALCTHQLSTDTRQAWVEIVPQSGETITFASLNTNHPAETNTNSCGSYVYIILRLPFATVLSSFAAGQRGINGADIYSPITISISSILQSASSLRSFKIFAPLATAAVAALASVSASTVNLSLPSVSTATSIIQSSVAIQYANIDFGTSTVSLGNIATACTGLQSLTVVAPNGNTATAAFGNGVQANSCHSLRRLLLPGLKVGFILQWTAMQSEELNALFTSLGTASGAQTIDIRNNPGSLTCDVSIAVIKGYTILTA